MPEDLGLTNIKLIAGREVDYVGVEGFGLTLESTRPLSRKRIIKRLSLITPASLVMFGIDDFFGKDVPSQHRERRNSLGWSSDQE